jgi:thiol:disulfide interchange protein
VAGLTEVTAINQLYQYPPATVGVGLVIAVMAVGMCGWFTTRLPRWVHLFEPGYESVGGAMGVGVMAAVLSTPCTAPLMGAAAAWAATQEWGVTLATFGAVGAGMALPYVVLAAWPRLVEKVPRTGPASELVKQVMGVLMLAAAAYFVGVGISGWMVQEGEQAGLWYWWPVMGFVAAAGLWLAWRTARIARSPGRRVAFVGVGLLMAAGAVYGGVRLTDRGPVQWVAYTPERLEAALSAGRVVVLDFTAEWCLNCKWLEKNVLSAPRVAELLNGAGVAAMKVDLTGKNEAGREKLRRVGRVAIPLLVVYTPGGEEVFKSDFYTVEQVAAAVERAKVGG